MLNKLLQSDIIVNLVSATKNMTLPDALDIFVVALIIFQVIRMVKGTRNGQVLLGLCFLALVNKLATRYELLTLSFLISYFISNLFLVLVILFASDIRRGLARTAGRFTFSKADSQALVAVNEVVRASFFMAEKRTGALIVFERRVSLGEYVEAGAKLFSVVSDRLLLAIFNTKAPLHDGAVIIQDGRLAAAGCFLPLLPSEDHISQFFGTRHRAAIGLSRESDAIVVVVSEERGLVSLVRDGDVEVMMGAGMLRDRLLAHLGLSPDKKMAQSRKGPGARP
ncbi:MAG: diadenylate cyclase CdaA [Deltaproteobacteria bacterium]|jgi:diadenylate cyclase|nr:diadenylate cyclase CdaA [Deltaproteobacteria bacterium]